MNLRDILSGSKNEFIWSLVIEPGWVQAGIWTIIGDEAKVVAVSAPVAWETNKDLETASDSALSSAIQTLPEEITDINKVVFGVPASWVQNGQIKGEHLENLKALCGKLTLKPSGFVTLPEAVSFFIKSQEGSPLSAVVISPGREMVETTVFQFGNLIGTTQVARSLSLFDDVVEGIGRFNFHDAVPSRFILFDGKEGELVEAKQSLLEGPWEHVTKFKLLHTPKIEILDGEKKVEAVSLGGAAEIGKVSKIRMPDADEKPKAAEDLREHQNVAEVHPENFGFVVEKDIKNEKEQPPSKVEDSKEAPKSHAGKNEKLDKAKLGLGLLIDKARKVVSGGKNPILMGGVALIVVIAGLFAFWWFYPKATVTIFVAPQKLDEGVSMFVGTNHPAVDFDKKIIPGDLVNNEQTGEKTISTTGNKLVGDKASGEIEIKNGRSDDLKLPAGTIVISSASLEFTTQKEATIPAQSEPGQPGSGKVNVGATDIGSEYNLSKDEKFKIANYPKAEILGMATADFSGGSSRQIQAVSQDDKDKVLDELTTELEDKANEAIKLATPPDKFFIDGSIESKVTSQTYSGKVGDEADNLKLSLSVNITGLTVSRKDLFDLANNTLKSKIPSGYTLRESQVGYEFDKVNEDNGTYELQSRMTANLLPEINTDAIAKDISGKYTLVAEDFLKRTPGFVRAQINISPRFPGKLGTLPHIVKNISVEVSAEK